MKNKIKILSLLLFITVINFSCKKYLTTTPSDTIVSNYYYANDAQLNAALGGVYSYLAQDGTFSRNLVLELEMGNDEGQFNNRNNKSGNPSLYDCQSSQSIYSDCWTALYAGINAANLLLANIDASGAAANTKSVVKGEATFLRGFYYFQLVSRYGDVPLRLQPTTQVGNFNYPRTPSIQVYNQILTDLKNAQSLVNDISSNVTPSHVNKTAIAGIIARVYLKMAGHPLNLGLPMYDSASVYAESVISSGIHSLNPSYKQFFINLLQDKYDNNESMWEVEFYGNNTPSGTMPPGSRFPCQLAMRYVGVDPNPQMVYCYGSYTPTGYLYDSIYQKYPSDTLRRDWNIPPYTLSKIGTTDSTSILPIVLPVVNAVFKPASSHWDMDCGKWKREYETYLPKSRDWSPTNFPVIRYADVLLMAAEAENEMGNPDVALVYLNQVRARALAEAVPSTDQVSLRQIIRDERARELCFEGLRKFDLIRWGVFFKSILTCRNSINNSSSSSSLKARYLTAYNNAGLRDTLLPIPSSELNVNGLMTQNAGW